MPIYEYVCVDCDQKFEKLLLRKNDQIQCPKCGGAQNELQFSVFGFGINTGNGVSFSPSVGGG